MAKRKNKGDDDGETTADEGLLPAAATTDANNELAARTGHSGPPGLLVNNMMDMLHAGISKQFGSKVYTAAEQEKRTFGVEIPSLAVQWLIHCNVIPNQSLITFEGQPKTYKTSTLLELNRWFMAVGGGADYIGTEGKLSPTKVTSMLPVEMVHRLRLQMCSSVDGDDGWQAAASARLAYIESICEMIREKRKLRPIPEGFENAFLSPQMIGVDSVSGVQAADVVGTVKGQGYGDKSYPDRARLNTQWLNTWSSQLVGLPVTVVLMNHLKPSMNQSGGGSGQEMMTSPGGKGLGFHTSLCVRVKRIKELKVGAGISATNLPFPGQPAEGAQLGWQVYFSSIGVDRRNLEIDYIETFDDADRQYCYFDWNKCLVDLILLLKGDPKHRVRLEAALGEFVEYNCGSNGKFFSCEALGVKGKDQAQDQGMNIAKFGQMLQAPGEVRNRLQEALMIQRFQIWTPGLDLTIPRLFTAKKKGGGGSGKGKKATGDGDENGNGETNPMARLFSNVPPPE